MPEEIEKHRRIAWKVAHRWAIPAGLAPEVWESLKAISEFYLDGTAAADANKPAPKRATTKKAGK